MKQLHLCWYVMHFMVLSALISSTVRAQSFYQPESVEIAAFGSAVAVGADRLFVGESSGFKHPGTVHVYSRDAQGEWIMTDHLQASDGHVGDGFGSAIALDGGTLLVSNGRTVFIFERDEAGSYAEKTHLSGEGRFGSAVSVKGDWVAIGAAGQDEDAGAVHLYRRNVETGEWDMNAVLAGAVANARFGSAIALGDSRLLIGAPGNNQAALYRFVDEAWMLEATVSGADHGIQQSFGTAVDLWGDNVLVIGAPRAGEMAGAVKLIGQAGQELASLSPETASERTMFGSTVRASEAAIWVGAPFADGMAGRLYRFDRTASGEEWVFGQAVVPEEIRGRDRFGSSFDVQGTVALAGLPGAAYGEGSAVVMEEEDGWKVTGLLYNAGDPIEPVLGALAECTQGQAADFDCVQVDLVSFLPRRDMGMNRGVRLNDVWGWTDPVTGTEYALVGHLEGTVFVDLSDPADPVYLGTLPRTEGSPGSTWRDIKVYKDHAFIVADGAGAHGMQVFDLTQLRSVEAPPVQFAETAHYDQIFSSHNIVINEDTGFAFAVGASAGGETCGGGLHMIDIRDPVSPTFAGCFADPTTGRRKTGYSHDAQCVIYHGPDTEHRGKEICVGSNETAISISDVTDKANPVALGSGSYPDAAYVHQGWLSDDHAYFYQNDELDELGGRVDRTRTLVWDVRDLDDPQMVNQYFGPTSATDHNLYVHGDLMYQTNNASGLRILDISSREEPVEVGFFDTTPYGTDESGFNGTWSSYPYFESGIIVVTSRREGLFMLKKQSVDT